MHTQTHSLPEEKVPLISFVVPCYNLPSEWVCACIDSIIALPLEREERQIIVVDDGSDSPVSESLEAYGADIFCLRTPNAGLGAARNVGMSHARGTYIQFVDGDDRLSSADYTRCIQVLKKEMPDMLLFRFMGKQQPALPPTNGISYMTHINLRASACLYLFRRTMATNLRFISGILHEDEAFTPQLMLRAAKVCDTGIGAYLYRRRPSSITRSVDESHLRKRLSDKEAVLFMLKKLASHLPSPATEALQRRVAQLTMDLLIDTIRFTRGKKPLTERIARLRCQQLFPLPRRMYTPHYYMFAFLSSSSTGLSLLRLVCGKRK